MTVFLFFISQVVSDPAQVLVFGFGSEILGVVTYSLFKVNVAAATGTLATVFLFLPVIYIALVAPSQSTSQSIISITNWLVTFLQGLPASILGDIGGTIAAAIMTG